VASDELAERVEGCMIAVRGAPVAAAVHDLSHEPVDVVDPVQKALAVGATQVAVQVSVQTALERSAQGEPC
jgi:hypothetical protein